MKALKERVTKYHMYVIGGYIRITSCIEYVSVSMYLCNCNLYVRACMHTYTFTIPFVAQRVACLLRKVVQEIERRISTQAEHLRTVRIILDFLILNCFS
jgi:hypothetical protein